MGLVSPGALCRIVLGLIALTLTACSDDASPKAPSNIVLISLDTLRADHLGCYGYFRDTSPAIDAFAAKTLFFDRCIVPMATTLPSHVAILTATYPMENGIVSNTVFGGSRFVTTDRLRSFAQICTEAGYGTAAFVSAAAVKKETGIDAGFKTFDEPEQMERRAKDTADAALAWLAETREGPFFLWVHFYDPHFPFDPPPPFDTRFETDGPLEEYMAERKIPDSAPRPLVKLVDDARKVTNAYDGEIRYMDDHVARVLAGLASRPDWDRTAVVLIGDHGEGLCQHGETAHGATWNEQLHAPLMMRIPGEAPRRIDATVSSVDVLPTLLGLLDQPELAALKTQASGKNVLDKAFRPTPVISQDTGRKQMRPGYRYTLTSDRWKFFFHAGGDGPDTLYDVKEDPFELNDVAADQEPVARAMRQALVALIRSQQERSEKLLGGATTVPQTIDPALLDQLKALGYVDEGD